jgi:hypothetical protein
MVFWIEIPKQSFQFFPKNRFDIDGPTVCLVDDFSKFTSVVSHRKTPGYKEKE